MALQFNLLPNIKQDYLKTQRSKRTIIGSAIVASALTVFILIFMMTTVYIINKKKLNDADKDIKKYSSELKAIPNIDKVLTVQNQLKSLLDLHQNKHIVSRLYDYLPQVTPNNVCLAKVDLDTINNSLIIEGNTDSLKSINTYVDTLKFTTHSNGENSKVRAFPKVVQSQFGINSNNSGSDGSKCAGKPANATYQLTVEYDPVLFINSQKVTLNVPTGLATTRSVLSDPTNALFNGEPATTKQNTTNSQGATR